MLVKAVSNGDASTGKSLNGSTQMQPLLLFSILDLTSIDQEQDYD
jgi:hypothetical protein